MLILPYFHNMIILPALVLKIKYICQSLNLVCWRDLDNRYCPLFGVFILEGEGNFASIYVLLSNLQMVLE